MVGMQDPKSARRYLAELRQAGLVSWEFDTAAGMNRYAVEGVA